MRVAALSDVHGNRWALEVVLEDIERRGIRHIVNLGDSLYGPLDPGGTARILVDLDIPTVRGNEDRILAEKAARRATPVTVSMMRRSLEPEHLRWLENLPSTLTVHDDLFLCHGSPERDDEYLLRKVLKTGVIPRPRDEIAHAVRLVKAPVVLCGHDHMPAVIRLADEKQIVNPGSVGCPCFADDVPFPHRMEAGGPDARYSVVSKDDAGWHVEPITLNYDWEGAARTAETNGRPDWAAWLRTGRAG